ncbi:MAG: helix-turn-helix domain-containing protein [Planctomycetota bacterium]|nr:helix-turn-helix domain-containing protein [Planctomycetota bacterium]
MHSSTPTPALLLTPKQAAESLSISPRKLWALTASGEIPHVRIGRCVRYDFADLQQWIADHRRRGRS